jgi:acetate---CoA ligase (ADP-forming)
MRKLKSLFQPKKIAIIGATDRPASVGLGLVKNLSQGKRKLFFVNPNLEKVKGKRTYPSILSLKEKIDLAVVAVPAPIVSSVVRECGLQGVKNIIVISAGFAEIGKEGKRRQAELMKIVREYKLNLVGPNCLGIIRPATCLNASFAPAMPPKGEIAFVSQSGALLDSVIDQSLIENYGFSTLISYGNEADLSLEDYLIFLEKDKKTKVILLYLEGVKDGRRFLEVARKITFKKPIVVLKAGRTTSGKKAVASHTASLAGADEVYRAAFKQAGIIVVDSLEELLAVAKSLAWQPSFRSKLAVVTNGGGMGVLTTDYAQEEKLTLASLSQDTLRKLKSSLPSTVSLINPLDIVGDASAKRYQLALEAILSQKNVGGVIVIQTIQTVTEVMKNAKVIVESHHRFPRKPIVSVCLKGKLSQKGIAYLEKHNLPNYSDPWLAVKAIKALRKSPFS